MYLFWNHVHIDQDVPHTGQVAGKSYKSPVGQPYTDSGGFCTKCQRSSLRQWLGLQIPTGKAPWKKQMGTLKDIISSSASVHSRLQFFLKWKGWWGILKVQVSPLLLSWYKFVLYLCCRRVTHVYSVYYMVRLRHWLEEEEVEHSHSTSRDCFFELC